MRAPGGGGIGLPVVDRGGGGIDFPLEERGGSDGRAFGFTAPRRACRASPLSLFSPPGGRDGPLGAIGAGAPEDTTGRAGSVMLGRGVAAWGVVEEAWGDEERTAVELRVDAETTFLAVFLTGSGIATSSGTTARRMPRSSALRRTRSACASSMLEEWLFTPIPSPTARSRASLFERPSSRASS